MKHLLNLGGDFAGNFLVVSVSTYEFLTLFSTQVTHIRTTTQYLTGSGNLEAFLDTLVCLQFRHFVFPVSSPYSSLLGLAIGQERRPSDARPLTAVLRQPPHL